VLDLVLRDDSNPRSVAFQLRGLADVLVRIDRALGGVEPHFAPAVLSDLDRWSDASMLKPDEALARWLDALSAAAATLSDRLSMRFFTHAEDRNRATFAA
jgi:uncharacterized alpha-E superfamily protein